MGQQRPMPGLRSAAVAARTVAARRTRDAIRVFVVSDVRLFREGLARILRKETSIVVVGDGSTDNESVRRMEAARPWVVVVDASTVQIVELVHRITSALPACTVIAVGVNEWESEVLRCAEAGVGGYLVRDASVLDLVDGIKSVAAGVFPCPTTIAAILFRHFAGAASRDQSYSIHSRLTQREREIAMLIDRGLTNKEIATSLSIEIATVKNHVHHILGKLGVARRAAIAATLRRTAHGPEGSAGV